MGRRLRRFIIPAILGMGLVTGLANPAFSMVPYVFLPSQKGLQDAGLGIAEEAVQMLRLGQPEYAARLAELTVRLLPNDPRGWVLLAEAQLRNNQSKEALRALAKAKALDPNNPGIWFAEGALALRNGKPSDALSLIQRGLQLDRRNAGAYFDLGNAHILLDQPDQALNAFERAAALRTNFWEAINNQGLVLYERGQQSEAIKLWRKVLTIKPSVAESSLALAAALNDDRATNRDEVFRLAESALADDPNYVKEEYQKEQLWGPRLREAARRLLADPALKPAVDRANANATGSQEAE
ncbi:MAG: tetratricopeptide repeat protein [Cyanobacteriota bacterium]